LKRLSKESIYYNVGYKINIKSKVEKIVEEEKLLSLNLKSASTY
jgi:hypothetical protein